MGARFLLALFTLSALLFTLHERADGYSKPDRVLVMNRARALLEVPRPEKSITEPPLAAKKEVGDREEREKGSEAPEPEIVEKEKHHSSDKSEAAGGGVIVCGLVTTIFAAVFCYIRVTRRKQAGNPEPESSPEPVEAPVAVQAPVPAQVPEITIAT